jgi:hypothetical protein
MLLLSGCVSVSESDYNVIKDELATERGKVAELNQQLVTERALSQEARMESQRRIDEITDNLTALQVDYENRLKAIIGGTEDSQLRNPTWAELKEFLENDDTDLLVYAEDKFDCTGFAITLRDRAWRYGLRSAYVEIRFLGAVGHALNAFQTVDHGLVYVDGVEIDAVAYVQVGQPYGTIPVNSVKSEFIDCDGSPAAFWGPLGRKTLHDVFSYDYYLQYQQRLNFYNDTVDTFNKAVDEYNRGGRTYSHDQLTKWQENILALGEDLGEDSYLPGEKVATIEIYWD